MKKNVFRMFLWILLFVFPLSTLYSDETEKKPATEKKQEAAPDNTTEEKPAEEKTAEEKKPPRVSVTNVLSEDFKLTDPRNGELRNTRDEFHPWTPADNLIDWEKQKAEIQKRILVSNGLYPMPPKAELKPVVFGRIDRGDYVVEKVFFASHPGHYVTGNLYRPANVNGKVPGILCPHGHWSDGRFYEAKEDVVKGQLEAGAEKLESGAKSPVQARMVQLARMGCIVFHYDMVGYADSKQNGHSHGFLSPEAGLYLQSFMGLQTFNSICALDFLMSLPDVDKERIAVTGSSGGGTQTFMLCAIDDRPDVAFPAVMVSTGMQGGCVCENAPYLRQGINNVALAATFAPKPMAMSGADDWTIAIETKGYPELQQIYGYYGKQEDVYAKAYPQFGHNYNLVARTMMYEWMKKYLELDANVSTEEKDFQPLTVEEMSVFSEGVTLPEDKVSPEELLAYLIKENQSRYRKMIPDSKEKMDQYKEEIGAAARVILCQGVPEGSLIESQAGEPVAITENIFHVKGLVKRTDSGEQVPFSFLMPAEGFQGSVVIWLEDEGKSCLFENDEKLRPEIQELVEKGNAVLSIDLYLTGEWLSEKPLEEMYPMSENYFGYTSCFNRPILSSRVNDIMTVIAGLYKLDFVYEINLVGRGKAGVAALLARSLAGNYITRTITDVEGFQFEKVKSSTDELFLPGALRYGGIGGFGALIAPAYVVLAGTESISESELDPLDKAYQAAGGKLVKKEQSLSRKEIINFLLD